MRRSKDNANVLNDLEKRLLYNIRLKTHLSSKKIKSIKKRFLYSLEKHYVTRKPTSIIFNEK